MVKVRLSYQRCTNSSQFKSTVHTFGQDLINPFYVKNCEVSIADPSTVFRIVFLKKTTFDTFYFHDVFEIVYLLIKLHNIFLSKHLVLLDFCNQIIQTFSTVEKVLSKNTFKITLLRQSIQFKAICWVLHNHIFASVGPFAIKFTDLCSSRTASSKAVAL